MKTSELTGAALDWAVAKCEDVNAESFRLFYSDAESDGDLEYHYSTNWSQGGPIIERERIEIRFDRSGRMHHAWNASTLERMLGGPTPLIAAMRCYVASKLGDKAKIPEELT